MGRMIGYATAGLGLWMVVAITTLPQAAALWVAFGTGLAIAAMGLAGFLYGRGRGEVATPAAAAASGIIGALIAIGSQQLEGATFGWGAAIGGAVVIALSLGAYAAAPRRAREPETVVLTVPVPVANGDGHPDRVASLS